MALVIEDGSLPYGANSYVTVEEVRAFADARALTVPEDDASVEASCIKSADYIRGMEYKFQGNRVSTDQAQTWPRDPVFIHGYAFPADSIPQELKDACCSVAVESTGGTDLQPNETGRATVREKVGSLEVQYADNGTEDGYVSFSVAESYLRPLFKEQYQTGSGGAGRTLRI